MDWLQPAAKTARGSLLFAAGRGDFIEKYIEACAHWHSAGWNVTAFDWRGQGRSRAGPRGDGAFSFDRLVDDLSVLLGAWRDSAPGPHAAIAHSMGAHLLLRTLVERRPQLDAAVLIAPMIQVNSWPLPPRIASGIAGLLCRLGRSSAPIWGASSANPEHRARRQTFLTGSAARYEDELWWRAQDPDFDLGGPSWSWLRAAYRSGTALGAASLAAVEVPVLLIGSDCDRLVSPAAIRTAAAALPRAELKMYPDAGHEILRESDQVRRDALGRIDDFLDDHAR